MRSKVRGFDGIFRGHLRPNGCNHSLHVFIHIWFTIVVRTSRRASPGAQSKPNAGNGSRRPSRAPPRRQVARPRQLPRQPTARQTGRITAGRSRRPSPHRQVTRRGRTEENPVAQFTLLVLLIVHPDNVRGELVALGRRDDVRALVRVGQWA